MLFYRHGIFGRSPASGLVARAFEIAPFKGVVVARVDPEESWLFVQSGAAPLSERQVRSARSSVNRAVSILGLGARAIYPLAGDEMGVIDASRLRETLDRVRSDAFFAPIHADIDALLDPSTFVGRAPV